MRRSARAVASALALAAAFAAAPAMAQAQPTRISIISVFDPISYGESAFVNGHLIGDGQGGQTVGLEESPFPFTAWTPVASETADDLGFYSFRLWPRVITHYRTVSQGMTSEREVQVTVAPRIALKAAAAGKASVRFSGTFAPAHPGQSVTIQRQHSGGSWTTVATARLRRGTTFTGRLHAKRPAVLRAFFTSDGDHADAYSRAVRAAPGT
jgi:hypothetical protein